MNTSCARPSRQLSQRGFSLSEMLVATAVFAFVILAAYQVFTRSRESYMLGAATADMVQGARVAFEQMNDDIRLAGYEFDVDGLVAPYASQPDEPLEYMHPRAIVIRGNLDFDKELRGREKRLENDDPDAGGTCCPIVTTANDEIVAYYLGKPSGAQPSGVIGFGADTTGTNEDPGLVDTVIRDATISPINATIHDEEWVTIDGVELLPPSDGGYAPPYTLYRAYIRDNSTAIEKMPLVDNIHSIEFTYYDRFGNIVVGPAAVGAQEAWGGTQSNVQGNLETEPGGGRTSRWSVTQVKVKLVTLTPDRDLRLARANPTAIDHMGGKRKFTLEADVRPPNLGVRGAKDRDITPPSPPRNIQVCGGECNGMRVSWDPGPPEERVADHVITICNGVCDGTNEKGQVLRFASFDAVNLREYYVLTAEDDSWISNGNAVGAWVVARNVSGTESECPVDDCADCCASEVGETAVVGTASRLESLLTVVGSGYRRQESNWPDAKKNNVAGLPIWTTETLGPPDNFPHPDYPLANELLLTLTPPSYMLNIANGAGSAPYNWTTKLDPGQSDPALGCFLEEATPSIVADDPNYRTPLAILWKYDKRPHIYVFRASGSDDTTWGDPAVTDPRNFVPSAANLYDFIDAGSKVFDSDYGFRDAAQAIDQDPSNDLWDGPTDTNMRASGHVAPPKAVTPCEVYYFRFRIVDICWKDETDVTGIIQVPDGVRDTDPTQTAWMRRSHFASDALWREASMNISPFYPPLLNEGDAAGLRDKPDPGVHDSDAVAANSSPDTYAVPAYALPVKGSDGNYIRPERPSELYLAKMDESRVNLLDEDNDGLTDARIVFNASRRNDPEVADWPPTDVAYTRYRLWRKGLSALTPTAGDLIFNENTATQVLEFRTTGLDPEPLLPLRRLTLDTAAEGAPGPGHGELVDLGDTFTPIGGFPFVYWLTAVQCTAFDDGIDTATGDESDASRPFLFPCAFYDQVESVDVTPTGAVVHATPTMHDDVDGGLDCGSVKAMRLLAYNSDGEYVGSSDWLDAQQVADDCVQRIIAAADVNQAKRGTTDSVSFVVELSDSTADVGADEFANTFGCRVRSDLLGEASAGGPQVIGAGCPVECETAGSPNIFGTVDETVITLVDADSLTDNVMRVEIPRIAACSGSFSLEQLEFTITKNGVIDNIIPDFVSANIVGGLQGGGSLTLPAILVGGPELDEGNEADIDGSDGSMTLRWYDSFCNAGLCSYPVVESGTNPLVVELHFAGEMCDVILAEFNFRVPYDDAGVVKQLLCSQRAGTDPDPPEGPGTSGVGRGPAASVEIACSGCPLTNCPTCKCPLQDNGDGDIEMDSNPTLLLTNRLDNFGDNAVLNLGYTENSACDSPSCDFELNAFKIRIECDVAQDCIDGLTFINILDNGGYPARLIHGDATFENLGAPVPDEGNADYSEYTWSGLSIPIFDGESFTIELTFDTDLSTAKITVLDLRVGGALPSVCGPNGEAGVGGNQASLCRKTSLFIEMP